MASFTDSGARVVERTLRDGITPPGTQDLEQMYEITRCVRWIQAGGYKKVGLQFPDELLGDSAGVACVITQQLGFHVYILGDTTYGSCCVDEVAAEHVGADAVIHFGRSCLSPSRRLPVLYIFTRIPVSMSAVVAGLQTAVEDRTRQLILVFDTRCHYVASDVAEKLSSSFPHLTTSALLMDWKCDCTEECLHKPEINSKTCCHNGDDQDDEAENVKILTFSGRTVYLPSETNIKDLSFIYLGPSSPTFNTLLLRFSENTFYRSEPGDGSVEVTSGVRAVMNRSSKLEMAKDADIIGILVGTLGVADYRHIITKLKTVIKSAGKRSYTFVVGKPNEPKLANISEVDVFVYVACPETSLVERHTDPSVYRKLLTPWELEVALLPGQEWSLAFEVDFRQLLPGGSSHVETKDEPREQETSVSLLTNKMQSVGVRDGAAAATLDSSTGAVVLHNGMAIATVHAGGGGEALKGRTWQGLDPSQPPVGKVGAVVEGRKGVASVYQDEVM